MDFDGSDVGLLVDVFDVGFVDVAVLHLDLEGEPTNAGMVSPVKKWVLSWPNRRASD